MYVWVGQDTFEELSNYIDLIKLTEINDKPRMFALHVD